jgi:uncharacterized membrane protein
MSLLKRILLWVMAAFYVFGGFNHLINPEFYLAIMPPGLPNPEWLNLLSGLAEIVLGVYVLEPRVRVLAAWGIIALLIAVFPSPARATQSPTGSGCRSRRSSSSGRGGTPGRRRPTDAGQVTMR